jgi:hypothetical protein
LLAGQPPVAQIAFQELGKIERAAVFGGPPAAEVPEVGAGGALGGGGAALCLQPGKVLV